jgi:hypothetical protein
VGARLAELAASGAITGIRVFIDGPHHAAYQDRRALEDRGYRMITIGPDWPLAEQIDAYPDLFAPAANGR